MFFQFIGHHCTHTFIGSVHLKLVVGCLLTELEGNIAGWIAMACLKLHVVDVSNEAMSDRHDVGHVLLK